MGERTESGEKPAPGRSGLPAEGPSQMHGLARDDAEIVRTFVHHVVGVVDQCHDPSVRVHVGRRDVGVGSDVVAEFGDIAARDAIEIFGTEPLGVTHHTALGPPEWDAHDRALPGHQRSESAHFVGRHGGMVSDATLAGAAAPAMDAPVPDEVQDRSRARSDRELHDGQFVGSFQELEESGLERGQVSGRVVALTLSDHERIELFGPLWLGGRHVGVFSGHCPGLRASCKARSE